MLAHHLLLAVLAQASAPDAWDVWSSPGALIGAIGAVGALAGWLIRQDRRLGRAEELQVAIFGDNKGTPGALPTMAQRLEASIEAKVAPLQLRHDCGTCRSEVDEQRRDSVAKAHEAIRELEQRVVAGEKGELELRGDLKAALAGLEDVKSLVRQLSKDVASLSLSIRKALPRTRTGQATVEDEEG